MNRVIDGKIAEIKKLLINSTKLKILCVSTTANIKNSDLFFGPSRETQTTIAANLILRNDDYFKKIIEEFDGVADYFFVDPEIKNELKNLESFFIANIKKSKLLIVKPNDFTVESVDMFIACLFGSLLNKQVLILGGGNIGSKMALRLSERGANVFIYDLNIEKVKKIIIGLELFKRGSGSLIASSDKYDGASHADLIIGCTPGIPVIDKKIIADMNSAGVIIDIGLGTIWPEAIDEARKKGIKIFSGSNLPGYIGMVENWLEWNKILTSLGRKKINDEIILVTRGFLGLAEFYLKKFTI